MNVVIRVDASVAIGTGHVMRCLTLADALRSRGSTVIFVCREHEGHLCDFIEANGFVTFRLPAPAQTQSTLPRDDYAAWLGIIQATDADQTLACCHRGDSRADWLVADHYALDAVWENRVRNLALSVLVIDDIANRHHACEILLDQNLGCQKSDIDRWFRITAACSLGRDTPYFEKNSPMRRAGSADVPETSAGY